jgi:hypothetical protein
MGESDLPSPIFFDQQPQYLVKMVTNYPEKGYNMDAFVALITIPGCDLE